MICERKAQSIFPEVVEAIGGELGVKHGVLNVPVPEIVLESALRHSEHPRDLVYCRLRNKYDFDRIRLIAGGSEMECARRLRDKADRCIRLSHGINSPADVALLEAIAAEANQAAMEIEIAEAARRDNAKSANP